MATKKYGYNQYKPDGPAGMDIVDQIKVVETTSRNGHQDVPAEPVMINKATAVNETVSAD